MIGFNLVLVARNQASLERLAEELAGAHPIQVTVIVQDLTDPASPEVILKQLSDKSISIDVLVNNAGTQVYGEFIKANLEQQLAMIQVNATTLIHLTHLLLPGMIRKGWGRILNVGSTGSFAPGPLNAVYCATKGFVLSFSIAIGAELAGTGVTVTAVCPGATETPFITRHGMRDVRLFRKTMLPAQVAQIGYRALKRGRPVVVAGFSNQLQVLFLSAHGSFAAIHPTRQVNGYW